jgi:uncharacterized protein (DUF2336 family)
VDTDAISPEILLALARSHQDPEARARLADQIGTVMLTHGLSARLQAAEILASLLPRLDERVRAHLARRIASSADVPNALVRRFAEDVIGIAYPILLDSLVLTEADLVAIVASQGAEHRLAIAQRSELSEAVTASLVSHGPESVIEKTLRNPKARFSNNTFRAATRLARQIERLQIPLATRDDLPAQIAQEILSFVSEEVRSEILRRRRPKAARASSLDPALMSEITAAINRRRAVDGALLLATLRGGAVELFDPLLALAVGAPVGPLCDALAQAPHRVLPAAAVLIGLSATQFSHLWLHFRQARPAIGEEDLSVAKILSTYSTLTRETAERDLRALLPTPTQRRRA